MSSKMNLVVDRIGRDTRSVTQGMRGEAWQAGSHGFSCTAKPKSDPGERKKKFYGAPQEHHS